jgi:hypothetical protein
VAVRVKKEKCDCSPAWSMMRARQLAYPVGAEVQTDCAVPLKGT